MDDVQIESIRRLTLGPDDTLVIRNLTHRLTLDEVDAVKRRVKAELGEQARVLVVSRDWELIVAGPDAVAT